MDVAIREAERAVRVRPDDPLALRGLVELLERAGDARAVLAALDQGAARGDAHAHAELRRRLARPRPPVPRGRLHARVAPLPDAGVRPVAAPRLLGLAGGLLVVGWSEPFWRGLGDASHEGDGADGVAALDPVTLEPRWWRLDRAAVALVGGDVVVSVPGAGARLELLDGATGATRLAAPLPHFVADQPHGQPGGGVDGVVGQGLLGGALSVAAGRVAAVDLTPVPGRFGRVRKPVVIVRDPSRTRSGFQAWATPAGIVVVHAPTWRLRRVDARGDVAPAPWPEGARRVGLADAAGDGELLLWARDGDLGPHVELRPDLLDAAAWRADGLEAAWFVGDDLVAGLAGRDVVSIRSRATGAPRALATLPPHRPASGVTVPAPAGAAADALVVPRVFPDGVALLAIGADGAPVVEARVKLGAAPVQVAPPLVIDDAVLLAVTRADGRIDLVRFSL